MEQLKIKDILDLVLRLEKSGMSLTNIRELPIYLGDDDELNGIHNGWEICLIDSEDDDEDNAYLIELINENYGTTQLKGKGILIS